MNSIKKIEGPLPDRKQYRSVLPAQLLMFWENSQEPWGVKDIDSKYIYANRAYYYLLKIDPRKFCIVGHLDNELPSPISEFASHFQQHDRQTIEHQDRLCSIEIHPYGADQLIRPYYFDKYPLYEEQTRLCIGTIFHARKVENVLLKKSTPDEMMAFRILEYVINIMASHLRQGHPKLPMVLPSCCIMGIARLIRIQMRFGRVLKS